LTCFQAHAQPDANKLVQTAIDYWRDSSSYTEATMKIHRSDWQREMSFKAWTKGRDSTLVRFTAPAKDAGNASLTLKNNMWSYTPKINKLIKIPPSMMAQSWMGSDLSYQDLSKADDIIEYYDHVIIEEYKEEDHIVYVVESTPHETAPVVWGKEIIKIRDDYIMLEHEFFDQEMQLVKILKAHEITSTGSKLYARKMRMTKLENSEEWTEIINDKVEFGIKLPEYIFTLSNLRNPRK